MGPDSPDFFVSLFRFNGAGWHAACFNGAAPASQLSPHRGGPGERSPDRAGGGSEVRSPKFEVQSRGMQSLGPIRTREHAERACHRLSQLSQVISAAAVGRDKKILNLTNKAALVIEPAQLEIAAREEKLGECAEANRVEEFGEGKTLELQCGVLSFRLGNRKLECRAGWDWDKVLARLESFPVTSQWAEYLRRVPEIDKRRLLEDTKEPGAGRHARLSAAKLEDIGLKITREERFEVEAKPDAVLAECATP